MLYNTFILGLGSLNVLYKKMLIVNQSAIFFFFQIWKHNTEKQSKWQNSGYVKPVIVLRV